MEQMYTFHKTVHGYGHCLRNQPCEDASGSFSAENGKYHIAVVADGHGQARSFRSAAGSRMAVEVAMQCLQELGETFSENPEEADAFYSAVLDDTLARKIRIRQLTDTILSRWIDRVQNDYAENLPDAQELGEFAQYYQNPKKIPVMYGTTLIAALWLPKCLLLLHQGDGRCDVFYADGSVEQPIPWDERCVSPVSTSLCEPDAPDRIRHCVIDLAQKPVLACYMGSDGIDDSYRTQEGTHFFYRNLSCKRAQMTDAEFEAYLEEYLSNVSQLGSRDDVSTAGIIDMEKLPAMIPQMTSVMERFLLEQELLKYEEALNSKRRKHSLLKQKAAEAKDALKTAQEEFESAKKIHDAQISNLDKWHSALSAARQELECNQSRREFVEKSADQEAEQDMLFHSMMQLLNTFSMPLFRKCIDSIDDGIDAQAKRLEEKEKQYETLLAQAQNQKDSLDRLEEGLLEKEKLAEAAENAFEEFDADYRKIQQQVTELQARLEALRPKEETQ